MDTEPWFKWSFIQQTETWVGGAHRKMVYSLVMKWLS